MIVVMVICMYTWQYWRNHICMAACSVRPYRVCFLHSILYYAKFPIFPQITISTFMRSVAVFVLAGLYLVQQRSCDSGFAIESSCEVYGPADYASARL